ncbi:MAG: ABC transporter ATP-binding protein [Bacteroidota bacterium]
MPTLKINQLSKTYANGVQALKAVSLEIPTGLFGLLGPNGAGKSTLMRILSTLQDADSGTVTFEDMDVLTQKMEVRKIIGYLPQSFGLYPNISAEVLLNHLAVLRGWTSRKERKRIVTHLLDKTNLYADRHKKLGGFSGGMKRRFGIAQALLTRPKLLIVDEPTAGLDPSERNRFHNLLSELAEETVVILSTHIVEDVKELCTKMAIIHQGKVLLQDTPIRAMEQLAGKIYQKKIQTTELEDYKSRYTVIAEKLFLGKPLIQIYSDQPPANGFTPIPADLESVYFTTILESSSS